MPPSDSIEPRLKRRKSLLSLPDPLKEKEFEKLRKDLKALAASITSLQSLLECRSHSEDLQDIKEANDKVYWLIEATKKTTVDNENQNPEAAKALMSAMQDAAMQTSDLIELGLMKSRRLQKRIERVKRDVELVVGDADN
ncbi:hypothetical protein N7454_005463 [Penicillium verhagenii]|nr:hypothetical protein N7454_005463 [Penicillium verhagenii]